MLVKICGITNLGDALYCENLGADFLGFIFYPKSKRFVRPETVKEIIAQLSSNVKKVGVFVNEDADEVNRLSAYLGLDFVQLHGDESAGYCGMIHADIIKAFRVGRDFDFTSTEKYHNCRYLLDTFSAEEYGGTGKTFDWEIIPPEIGKKCFLSGGISIENVIETGQKINPFAVDLSSSLELSPGKKDLLKVKQFFELVKMNS